MAHPLVVAIDMGYGHLRAAAPLAEALGTELLEADRPPLAGEPEQRAWRRARRGYVALTRLSQMPVGAPLRPLLDAITRIPREGSPSPNAGARALEAMHRRGLGSGLVERLRATGEDLLTTFYAPAIAADRARVRGAIACVVTDTDVNRVWAPIDAAATRIRYFVPAEGTKQRLLSYGVPAARVDVTGFPLPLELLDGARERLDARLSRLAPGASAPPLVTFAIGGAGAQAELTRAFLPPLAPHVRAGRLRLALVPGVHRAAARIVRRAVERAGLEGAVEILEAPAIRDYLPAFNRLLSHTDVLWTKPSEMTFFAALGLPLFLSRAVGVHEERNAEWAVRAGAALPQGRAAHAAARLLAALSDGSLAKAAVAGWDRLPRDGTPKILSLVR